MNGHFQRYDGSNGRDIRYRDYTLSLTAGAPQSIDVFGDYWQLLETPAGAVTMELDDTSILIRQAPSGGPGNYRRVTFTSVLSQVIRVALGFTNGLLPYDSGFVIGGTFEVANRIPDSVQGLADLVITTGNTGTYAQNLSRDAICISLDDAAPDYVRVASGGAALGVRLYPGGSITFQTKGAIVVRNPNAVSVTVSASETYST